MESISRYTILSVWDCVRRKSSVWDCVCRKSKLKWSAGSPPEVRNQSPGQTSAFCLHHKKIAVSDPARGSNPTFLLGQKRRVRPASRGWWIYHWGKKASQTRLSGRTRELGLSVNAVYVTSRFNRLACHDTSILIFMLCWINTLCRGTLLTEEGSPRAHYQ